MQTPFQMFFHKFCNIIYNLKFRASVFFLKHSQRVSLLKAVKKDLENSFDYKFTGLVSTLPKNTSLHVFPTIF